MNKRSIKLIAILLALSLCLGIASVSLAEDDPATSDSPFVGKWVYSGIQDEDGTSDPNQLAGFESFFSGIYYEFKADGTCCLGMFSIQIPMTWEPGEEENTAVVKRHASSAGIPLKIEGDHFVIQGEEGFTDAALIFTKEKTEAEEEIAPPAPEAVSLAGKWTAVRIEDASGAVILSAEDGSEGIKALLGTVYVDFTDEGICTVFAFGLKAEAAWVAVSDDGKAYKIGPDNSGGGLDVVVEDGLIKVTDPGEEFPFTVVLAKTEAEALAEEPEEKPAEEAAETPEEASAAEPEEAAAPEEEPEEPAEPEQAPEDAGEDRAAEPEPEEKPVQRPWWW